MKYNKDYILNNTAMMLINGYLNLCLKKPRQIKENENSEMQSRVSWVIQGTDIPEL